MLKFLAIFIVALYAVAAVFLSMHMQSSPMHTGYLHIMASAFLVLGGAVGGYALCLFNAREVQS